MPVIGTSNEIRAGTHWKLDRFVADYPDSYKLLKQTDIDKTYSMPKSYVTYRKPRTVSDKQREQARQRMAKLNFANN